MRRIDLRVVIAVLFAGMISGLCAGSARAASISAGGWTFNWLTTDFSLTPLSINGTTMGLEKAGTFAQGPDQFGLIAPFEVNLAQTTPAVFGNLPATATDVLSLIENITNNSGVDWDGFRIIIEAGTTGTSSDVRFDTSTLSTLLNVGGSASNLGLPVWTNVSSVTGAAAPNVQEIDFTGGTLHNGETVRIGGTVATGVDGGAIGILAPRSATGSTNWVLKELPLTTGTTPTVPLPAALWSGLSGLMGLGVFGAFRRRARRS